MGHFCVTVQQKKKKKELQKPLAAGYKVGKTRRQEEA
jgi:hypothetical protein